MAPRGVARVTLRGRANAPRLAAVAYEGEKFSREVRMKEELASPFRGFRFFAYAGMLLGGSTSGYIALTGLLATLSGREGVVGKDQLVVNCAVNAGVVALAAVGVWNDLRLREQNLERIAERLAAKASTKKGGSGGAADDDLFIGTK
ncbi:hypothetical protein KFE25_000671 [Diacronema lutheri]|nr:hypothetical protein KFE25_000671 [Diacronema lutheri]